MPEGIDNSGDADCALVHQFPLDLLEGFVFGLGEGECNKYETSGADGGVEAEDTGSTQTGFQSGEGKGEEKTGEPEGGDGHGHGGTTDAIRKNFRDDDPGNRGE